MKCYSKKATDGACKRRATMYVKATNGKAWDGYYCSRHAVGIVKLRRRLIVKYKQSVIIRPITDWDKKQRKARHG